MGQPYLLHEEETYPDASELLLPEMADDDWPGPCWSEIWCRREDDGSWTIWFNSDNDEGEKEELETYRGLRTAEAFTDAYSEAGVDFGCSPDGTELSEHLEFFEREDPLFGAAMRALHEGDSSCLNSVSQG